MKGAVAAAPRPVTLREHAVATIRQAILSGALEPGTRIVEEDLAAQLGISRGPVREAIRALEQEGLVRSEPHRASYVTVLTEEEVERLYEVRAEVEAIAARRVATLVAAEPALLAAYRVLLDRLRLAAAERDLDALATADVELHRRLLDDSGYSVLPRVWRAMDAVVRGRVRDIVVASTSTAAGSEIIAYTADSHAPIVDALAGGDGEAAAAAVRQHILETRDLWTAARASA